MSRAKGIVVSSWLRQFHRWVSIAFTATVIANFVARAKGTPSALGDLLAAAPARRASANGPLFIRAALYCEVAHQERGMKRSRTSEALASGLIRTGVHLLAVFWCGPIVVGQ
jgi:hypothetical protein